MRIWNSTQAFEWYHFEWPGVTYQNIQSREASRCLSTTAELVVRSHYSGACPWRSQTFDSLLDACTLLSRRSRQRERLHATACPSVRLFVCLSVCLSPNYKNAIFSKTKQFRAMVSIDWDPPSWKSTWRHFSAERGPIWIKFRRLVQNDMSTAVIWSKPNQM